MTLLIVVGLLTVGVDVEAQAAERRGAPQPAAATSAAYATVTPTATPTAVAPVAALAITPAATATPVPPPVPVTNTCAITADLAAAVALATAQGEQSGATVLDTSTGTVVSAGAAETAFDTASVVKVLIATELLLQGQMTGATATTAQQMIALSDDDAADALYDLAGGDAIVTDVAAHYAITNLGSPPAETGEWGETTVTADGLARLYAALKADPVVWPWLSQAMSGAQQTAADGTDQFFGIPATTTTGWAVKQGWMVGLGPGATYNTTGYVDGDRYVVVILTHGSAADYDSVLPTTLSAMARDVIPAPGVGAATATCPA